MLNDKLKDEILSLCDISFDNDQDKFCRSLFFKLAIPLRNQRNCLMV